jgi:GDP-L-fucose synthase
MAGRPCDDWEAIAQGLFSLFAETDRSFVDRESRIFVAGSETLVGAAIVSCLKRQGYVRVIGQGQSGPRLTSAVEVHEFFARSHPEFVFHAAGSSGGIAANQRRPAELCHDNLLVTAHLLDAARQHRVKRLLYLASSCCYPRECAQPMRVEDLWSGPLEPTNEAYAAAKLAGIALCRAYRAQYDVDFRVCVHANVFGPGDDLDPDDAHVISALMVRVHEAKCRGEPAVTVWGTGRPRRDFIFADDLAEACLFVLQQQCCPDVINLGSGHDISIAELAERVCRTVGYRGRLQFDATRSDGMPQKLLDSGPLAALGFRSLTSLDDALASTYRWYRLMIEAPETPHVG